MQILEQEHLAYMRSINHSYDPSGPYVPYHRNEAYPAHLCRVNFRKLSLKTLMLYAALFGINVRPDCTRDECATAVAIHFVTWKVDEATVMKYIKEKVGKISEGKKYFNTEIIKPSPHKKIKTVERQYTNTNSPKVGDIVAALIKGKQHICTNEGWILGKISKICEDNHYEVQDEDDDSRTYTLGKEQIVPLSFSTVSTLKKGWNCLAVFPDTTSFYKATINSPIVKDEKIISVCFEDDVDSDDQQIIRNIRADYIIPLPNNKPPFSIGKVRAGSGRGRGAKSGVRKGFKSGRKSSIGSANGSDTYSNRIAHALRKLPEFKGSFTEICDIIEKDFTDKLNWKLESDVRRTPVWKSSVRKILISNQRFKPVGALSNHVFTFSCPEVIYNG